MGDWLARTFFRIGERKTGFDRPFGEFERKYLWTLPVAVAISLVSTALEAVSIGLLVPLLDVIIGAERTTSGVLAPLAAVIDVSRRLIPSQPLIAIGGLMLLLVIFKNVIGTVGGLFMARIDGQAGSDLRSMIGRRLLQEPYAFFLTEEHPRLVNIISSDSWRVNEVLHALYGIASSFASALALSILALIVNWKLFLVVIVGALFAHLLQRRASKKVVTLSERVSVANTVLGERMLLIIDLSRLIRVFNQEKNEQRAFDAASENVRQALYNVERSSAFFGPAIETLMALLFILVLAFAQLMHMTASETLAFLVLQYRLQPHVMGVNQGFIDLAGLQGSVREVEWLLSDDGLDKIPRQLGGPRHEAFNQPLRFCDVDYTYPWDEAPVISNASFDIPAGSVTALIGRSGAGKSTIINLITRLVDPTKGSIFYGDTDLATIDPGEWRSHIALAGQDIDLIEGTVADNIAYRVENLSETDIEQAAKIADAHDFIMAMAGGYQARINSYGSNLSGGQRQRICLARALVRKPDLLVLDEATNAVDGISETIIMRLLQQHRSFGTAIVISHRRSTLQACTRGIVIEHGRIVESGALRDLDFYRDMERWPDELQAQDDT